VDTAARRKDGGNIFGSSTVAFQQGSEKSLVLGGPRPRWPIVPGCWMAAGWLPPKSSCETDDLETFRIPFAKIKGGRLGISHRPAVFCGNNYWRRSHL